MERLQKVMAQAGIASRRKCEEMITAGRVTVNGETVTALGSKVDPAADEIRVDGRLLDKEKFVYYMFHKPKGVITSMSDPQGRKTVSDYIRGVKERVFPVGRLDYDTEGLLLLTNDGELANRLLHPSRHVKKTYIATVEGIPHGDKLEKLANGIKLQDGMTKPAEVEYRDVNLEKNQATIIISITEGRNRQVRRMFEAIGHPVRLLKRVGFGPLLLEGVPRGKYRKLTPEEIAGLQQAEDSLLP
ncbi:MAG TPA: pseudouridine synthase [Bacilli bacterium]